MGCVYEYQVPDPRRPLPSEGIGPSGELVPFIPGTLAPQHVVGRQVAELSPHVGTYGMGGPGFLGLRLGHEWLVVALWGAAEWTHVNGRLVQDVFSAEYGRPPAWIHDGVDELSPRLVGATVSSLRVLQHSLEIVFSTGDLLRIEETPDKRPILEGSKEPRAFSDEDDLRRAVFLAPTAEIWV